MAIKPINVNYDFIAMRFVVLGYKVNLLINEKGNECKRAIKCAVLCDFCVLYYSVLDQNESTELFLFLFSDACHPYEPFKCPGDGNCISIQYLCDGAPDCSDGWASIINWVIPTLNADFGFNLFFRYDEDMRLCTAGMYRCLKVNLLRHCVEFLSFVFMSMTSWKKNDINHKIFP